MMLMQGQIAAPGAPAPSGSQPVVLLGPQGEQLNAKLHGDNYTQNKNGKLFHGCSVVGGNAFPIYSATALVFALWNPLGSGVDLELVKFTAGYVSGTGVAGPFGYSFKSDAGAQAATGSPVAAFNHVSTGIIGGNLGAGSVSAARFSNAATNTIVAAPTTNFIPGNLSQLVTTAADATNVPFIMEEQFNGSIIVPPGVLFFPCALLASVSLFAMKLTWNEVPRGS
jgi:hypothetical protein